MRQPPSEFSSFFDRAEKLKRKYPAKAQPLFLRALSLARRQGLRKAEAQCLYQLGDCAADQEPRDSKEALSYYAEALKALHDLEEPVLRANILFSQGIIFFDLNEYEDAEPRFTNALELFDQLGDHDSEASCSFYLADCLFNRADVDLEKVLALYEKTRMLFHASGDRSSEARCLYQMGVLYQNLRQSQRAAKAWQSALRLAQDEKDAATQIFLKRSLGALADQMQNYASARRFYQEAIALSHKSKDRLSEGLCYHDLAVTDQNRGDHQKAKTALQRAIKLYGKEKQQNEEASARVALADSHLALDEWEPAKLELEKAIGLFRRVEDALGLQQAFERSAETSLALKDLQQAKLCYERACQISRLRHDKEGLLNLLVFLGDLNRTLGDTTAYRANNEEALELARELRDRSSEARCLFMVGMSYMDHSLDEAKDYVEQALAISRTLETANDNTQTAVCLADLARIHALKGDWVKAKVTEEDAAAHYGQIWDHHEQAHALARAGSLDLKLGHPFEALETLTKSLGLLRENKSMACVAAIYPDLVETHVKLGQWEIAFERWNDWFTISEADDLQLARSALALAEPLAKQQRLEYVRRALTQVEERLGKALRTASPATKTELGTVLTELRGRLGELSAKLPPDAGPPAAV